MSTVNLNGISFCITGTLSIPRNEYEKILKEKGAEVHDTVKKTTKYLVVGEDPGASKLTKAEKNGTKIINEQQLKEILEAKQDQSTSEVQKQATEVQKAITPEVTAPKQTTPDVSQQATQNNIPMPITNFKLNGPYVEYFPGTDKVQLSGTYCDGLKHGSFKLYNENGQLLEDCEWEYGLKHGHELTWAENGNKTCVGRNEHGNRIGDWIMWYDNGSFFQSCTYCTYDEYHRNVFESKMTGEYKRDKQDSSPLVRGHLFKNRINGEWTRYNDGSWKMLNNKDCLWEKIVCNYHYDRKHGLDQGWYFGGQIAYKINWIYGRKHGLEEAFDIKGNPIFKGNWHYGYAVGNHTTWNEQGIAVTTEWINGIPPELTTDTNLIKDVKKKLQKARDAYSKENILTNAVEQASKKLWVEVSPNHSFNINGKTLMLPGRMSDTKLSASYLLFLWRNNHVAVDQDPELWEILAQAAVLMNGNEVIEFLKKAVHSDGGWILPYWPEYVDRLVLQVYAHDPDPIDAQWESLPDDYKNGVALVRARFGKDIGNALMDELDTLAEQHVGHGIGSGSPYHIQWPDDKGQVVVDKIILNDDGTHTPIFDKLISFFGTQEQWIAALKKAAFKKNSLYINRFKFLIEHASPEEVGKFIHKCSDDTKNIYKALTEWRHDDGETLQRIALTASDSGQYKCPVVCTAIIKLAEEGKTPSQELLNVFKFVAMITYDWLFITSQALHDLTYNPAYMNHYVSIEQGSVASSLSSPINATLIHKALRALSKESIHGLIERQTDLDVLQFLYLTDDSQRRERFILEYEKHVQQYNYHRKDYLYGIGDIGLSVVPLIETIMAHDKKKNEFQLAIIVALAHAIDEQGDFPERYDKYVIFDEKYIPDTFTPFLVHILFGLPSERAERILLNGLESKSFARAFSMISACPSQKVLSAAFTKLLAYESKLKDREPYNIETGIKSLVNPRDWVKWILKSGGGRVNVLRDKLKDCVGQTAFAEIEQELNQKAPEIDKIEQVRLRAIKAGGKGERIYLLRRFEAKDKPVPAGCLNVIGGNAPGVSKERWPMFNDEPMTHLFTLDISTMPVMGSVVGKDKRTLSLFCWHPQYNEAWEPYNKQTKIILSTAADLEKADKQTEKYDVWFEPVAIDLDPDIWYYEEDYEEDDEDDEKREKYEELISEITSAADARVLGNPIWIQDEEHENSGFIMQFNDRFVDINTGDGDMYVFNDTAFWQR